MAEVERGRASGRSINFDFNFLADLTCRRALELPRITAHSEEARPWRLSTLPQNSATCASQEPPACPETTLPAVVPSYVLAVVLTMEETDISSAIVLPLLPLWPPDFRDLIASFIRFRAATFRHRVNFCLLLDSISPHSTSSSTT
ncbi:uncharacterized protein MYCGRDRAFT_83234 [Zymoseptoria tritici IPO323]|uniref:Uncharacterized protein n=1 Tax=Zymoseptoria tritici (strain CBS 115943 / IPO323) TaxID=336722 RepID=F9XRV5_ZYMTI|nr:uncharacterized protein MYCGRDRAFT_83234 [Zymoseptoria tritici IPO323]EGP82030.1 hypothetical protein MYCGRDRAFT_83234 [Zymoseptoria tritici IPO323]